MSWGSSNVYDISHSSCSSSRSVRAHDHLDPFSSLSPSRTSASIHFLPCTRCHHYICQGECRRRWPTRPRRSLLQRRRNRRHTANPGRCNQRGRCCWRRRRTCSLGRRRSHIRSNHRRRNLLVAQTESRLSRGTRSQEEACFVRRLSRRGSMVL